MTNNQRHAEKYAAEIGLAGALRAEEQQDRGDAHAQGTERHQADFDPVPRQIPGQQSPGADPQDQNRQQRADVRLLLYQIGLPGELVDIRLGQHPQRPEVGPAQGSQE